jgi:dephospho-CoA kinase
VPVLGLIGGIGAGKSLVAAELAKRGALVVDADAVGHALLDQTPSRHEIVRRFGPEVLDREADTPRIDRRALGRIVFEDRHSLRDLEGILHPRMRKTFERAIARAVRKGAGQVIVLDAAILLEAGWDDLCDRIWYVDAPREVRLERLASQRGWTAPMLAAREQAQMPAEVKRQRADVVIQNDGDAQEQLSNEIERLWGELTKPPRGRPKSASGER